MNWKEVEINIGKVKTWSTYKFSFKSLKNLNIKDIETSCGCTEVIYNRDKKELTGVLRLKGFPLHLKGKKMIYQKKYITVIYEDLKRELLTLEYSFYE